MSGKDSVELTIRAAMIVKSASELVGTTHVTVAKLMVQNVKIKIRDLETFLDDVKEEAK